VVDGGGSSAGEGRGIYGDLVVVPVSLEEGRSGLLPTASLPQVDRALACSPGGRQLALLVEEEVAGAARWPDSEALRRRPSDGNLGVEERRGSASGRAGPDRSVGPVLDRGRAAGSRTRGGQVEGGR
jgi:hypothetical protein